MIIALTRKIKSLKKFNSRKKSDYVKVIVNIIPS